VIVPLLIEQSNYTVTTKSIRVSKKVSNYFISGKALAAARERAGLTQNDLGKALKRNRVTINGWEQREEVTLSEPEMEVVRRVLNVSDDSVLTKSPPAPVGPDILDHPVIRSLAAQSDYIIGRVKTLEEENKKLRGGQ
jgi:transcriptional regulator with XRE-family HTH domain